MELYLEIRDGDGSITMDSEIVFVYGNIDFDRN